MKFFVLENPDVGTTFDTDFLSVEPVILGSAVVCPACGRYVGQLPWLPPHRAELEFWGEDYGDIAFGPGGNLLVSQRFKGLWDASGLRGLSGFWPVDVVEMKWCKKQKFRTPPPEYYCVSIAQSRAAIDYVASGIEFQSGPGDDICPECNMGDDVTKRGHRLIFQPSTWSGEDVFFPRGRPAKFFASARFQAFCADNEIKNALLLPADNYSFGFKPWDLQKN